MAETTKPERHVRTAKEKAQDALGVADRKLKALEARKARAEEELEKVNALIEDVRSERTFLASHPALREQDTLPVGDEEASYDGPDDEA